MRNKCIAILMILLGASSCQEPYIPDTSEEDQLLVVEGYIEAGEGSLPTFVLLTKSIPFIGEIDQSIIESLFVRGAMVEVSNGTESVLLPELCLDQLPPEIRQVAVEALRFNPDSLQFNICAYVDILNQLPGMEGETYSLRIEVGEQVLTAMTSIPTFVPIDSFRWDHPPGEASDSLAELNITIDDPSGIDNYYRYFTGVNGQPVISPFASVTNDVFFDGKKFEFPLNKAEPRGGDIDPEEFGLFARGDSVVIKWTTIDADHFDFWNTLEFSANSGGPFSSYTRIAGNVEGALGIWGGYAVGYYSLLVPE